MDEIERNELTDLQKVAIKEEFMKATLGVAEKMFGHKATLDVFQTADDTANEFIEKVEKNAGERAAVRQAREEVSE